MARLISSFDGGRGEGRGPERHEVDQKRGGGGAAIESDNLAGDVTVGDGKR